MSAYLNSFTPLRHHYRSFRNEYQGTGQLFIIGALGTFFLSEGLFWQKYFLSAAVLLLTVIASAIITLRFKTIKPDWKTIAPGWQFIFLGLACLFIRELCNLLLGGTLPLSSTLLLWLTFISQISLTLGLMLLAWPTDKHAQIRAFIDSHIIVLALLVMAWAEGVHPFKLNMLELQFQHSYLHAALLWMNTLSGVLLLMSILFFVISAHNVPRPDRSTFWVFTGSTLFFLIHVVRTYTVGNFRWDQLSSSWLSVTCGGTIFSIILLLTGVLWYRSISNTVEQEIPLAQLNSQQRLITLWFPYGAALAVSLILLINEITPDSGESSGLLPIVLLLIAILSRQMLTMWDNLRLSAELTGSNTNLENNVMERTRHLAILHSITSALNSSLDRSSVLQIALEQIMNETNAEQGAIWLRQQQVIESEQAEWHLAYANGFPSKDHEDALREVSIETVEENAAPNSQSRLFFETTYGFPANSGKLLIVPLRSGGILLGAQALIFKNGKPNYETRSVVESIALEVGTALQNARLYQEARQRADRDGVTGLYNHRAIQEQLATLLRNSRKNKENFSVFMMDLNDFKYFNDTYGHPVGDNVLRTVAVQLKKICGEHNPIGRYGGDEFIVLLPGQDHQQTHQTYQNLLSALEKEHFEVAPGIHIPISMSYGWSVFPDDGQSALDLITIADANLYRYKQRGELEDSDSAADRRAASIDKSTAFGVLDALITAIDNKDHYTRKHSDEVARYAIFIGEELGYSDESLRAVRISGLLHDVGKIAVPDDILRHPGKLSQADWEIMKQHPSFGALIVKDLPYLEEVINGIRYHHERWDGCGYPDGLAGTQIPLMGRLLAVPDAYSALTTNRPYRKGLSPEEALREIERSIHTQFDPLIAKTFLEIMERQLELKLKDTDETQEFAARP